ncbi:T9SS type A sorting domain-containing protein [Flavobacterium branchiarum]|uniref:T9SS type A sorting domain-containing protein n=1 Tax=Flavobacterium branchiarum TaxID=1114870 RepID=A0ABV5FPJ7_9FLAO|nr:T9SS type A sorting domain-containing protein [Flavobacterium branchiarum]MDN3675541.1 T9SS type A sorting domain-containing protein [Flavobacterium branchiarum]
MKTKLLLLLLLANFTIHAQTNLVPNGNFETWTSSNQPNNWYPFFSGFVSQSTIAQNGKSSTNMMVASGTFTYINSEYFPIQANKTYRVTVYHKTVKGTFSSIDLSLYHKPGTFKEKVTQKSDVTFSTTEWRKIEFEYTSKISENIEVDIWTTGTLNSEILVDNVSVVDIADVPVQYTLIPDVNFEKKLISMGFDSGEVDGKVLTSDIKSLRTLYISGSNISDLTGIQDFTALTTLEVSSNKLTSIDISKNTALESLNCGWNSLATLDISNNLALTDLSCYYNNLKTIDVSKQINLRYLSCGGNGLTSLDINKNINLVNLSCYTNKLTTIDTSKNIYLETIDCIQNQITYLDLSNNTKLRRLECYSNDLTTLNLSKNLNLIYLECQYNALETLDVSKNIALIQFDASHNPTLKEVNLKNGKNTLIKSDKLSLTANPSLTCVLVDDVAYANTNWIKRKDPVAKFSESICSTPEYTLIPDANFEKSLIKKGIDGVEDGKVLTRAINTITTLDLSDYYTNLEIKDLTGIQDFIALENLKLPYNGKGKLTSIDVSKNLKLKVLNCEQNELTSLDVSKNLALTELNVYYNKLTTLDISKNLALTKVNVSYNKLTNIDVAKNLALTELNVTYNKLTTLDVTKNLALTNLHCSAAGSNNENSSQSTLTSLDLSKNIALEYLNASQNKNIKGFDLSNNINLTSISVGYNNLTTIDFTANKKLTYLNCEANLLKTLDLTKHPQLEKLFCGNNDINYLETKALPNLKQLHGERMSLTNIDFSKNPLLEIAYVSDNMLTSLDFSSNPNLKQLICSSNDLMKLNIKNGGNAKFNNSYYNSFANNPNLSCITVDDVTYSNNTWAKYKDASASYNTQCDFSLPSNNYTIESKGESCVNENNGEISITANAKLPYTASINGKPYTFTNNTLTASNLSPGAYNIIISIAGEKYEQSFNVSIAKATTISGTSNITARKVDVEITAGTAPFTVFVDGQAQFQTTDPNFSLDLNKGGLIEVATAKVCEGVFSKRITSLDAIRSLAAYPNPTSGNFEIDVPTNKKEIKIEVYNFGGQLVSTKNYNIEDGKAYLNIENQASGIYAVKIYLDTPEYIKIIKK